MAPRISTQKPRQEASRTSSLGYTKRPPPPYNKPNDSARRSNANAAPRILSKSVFPSPSIITQSTMQDFVPSETVKAFADKHSIVFPNKLQLVKGQKFGQFPVRFSACSSHVFSPYHLKYLTVFEHALRDKMLYLYHEKSSTPLWLYVQGLVQDGSPAVVRTTSERVARKAFHSALAAAGYQKSGRSIDPKGQPLHGTIRLLITSPKELFKVNYEDLVVYFTELIVGHTVWRLACGPRHFGTTSSVPVTIH